MKLLGEYEMKEVTVSDILDAIERNGLPKAKGEYFHRDTSEKIVGACALGQAAFNLDISPSDLDSKLTYIKEDDVDEYRYNLSSYIVDLNDNGNYSFEEIARRVRQKFSNSLNEAIEVIEVERTHLSI